MMTCCGMAVTRMVNVRSEQEVGGTPVNMETVTLIGKGR